MSLTDTKMTEYRSECILDLVTVAKTVLTQYFMLFCITKITFKKIKVSTKKRQLIYIKILYLRVLFMLLYPTPTQVIKTLSPPFLSSSGGF